LLLPDQNDDSLNRWKASLGLGTGTPIGDPSDPRKCIIKSLALEVEGRPDITIDLSAPGAVDTLKSKPFTIKEGSVFRIKATFVVQHEVLSGLKYIQVVKRKGVRVSKDEEMLVSSYYQQWHEAGEGWMLKVTLGQLSSKYHG
jgi:Rho GDP-dissociation inhibitor